MNLKLGKTAARPNSVTFKLKDYVTALPIPPSSFNKQDKVVSDWQMLGNDRYGDCVWAGAAHETMLWNQAVGQPVNFNTQSVLSDYMVVTGFDPNNPNSDQGTDMQVAASYRRKTGVIDANGQRHQILAYLAVTPTPYEIKQAIYVFGNVGVGFQFPDYAMDQFNQDQSWHLKAGGQIVGGHYVPAIGYDSRYVYVVTWGKLQKMTWKFLKKYCDEAIVYLSTEMIRNSQSPQGFNLASLQSDLENLQ